jgi:DNA modification methylase
VTNPAYTSFLERKVDFVRSSGFDVDAGEINPICKPHQRDLIRWAVQGGRRAIFAKFGLGKSIMQLEAMRLVCKRAGGVGLIIAPLGVRQEFRRDAKLLGFELPFIRTTEEITGPGLFLTNYESVREGKIDVSTLTAVSLDEASVLRGFGGTKTFREFMRLFAETPYRFVATATPSPNQYIEILAYSAFLGIMDIGEAKTRFFKRNSEKADQLTIHPHKEEEFWVWVHTWAVFLQRPSELGYSDEGYALPPLSVRWHAVKADVAPVDPDQADWSGQRSLMRETAMGSFGVQGAAAEKRSTLATRVEKVRSLIDERSEDHVIIWHDLEDERRAIEDMLPIAEYDHWREFRDGHPAALALYERHYSARPLADRKLFMGPGQKLVLLTQGDEALFAWRKFIDDAGQTGINCAVFRNESRIRSEDLIREAMAIAWLRWPGERFYTYVDAAEVQSSNPGYCFLQAGWSKCGETKTGLVILEALPGVDVPVVAPKNELRAVFGSQDLDEREDSIADFADGRIARLAAKPVMLGSGCNLQRHCAWAIYAGVGFKFNDFIQSVHRLYRFLQTREVVIDIIYAETETSVVRTLQEKWKRHDQMMERMAEIIAQYGLNSVAAQQRLVRSIGVERREERGEYFTAVNNDCVDETASMESSIVDLILTSIPFGTQYEYTPSYNDFGHTDDDEHFFQQMNFLSPELLRVLKPGRIMAIHVKDRIRPGGLEGLGFQTVSPFHAECILHYRRQGFAYMGMITVVTDVVRENNQTYRLGWTEQCKDGSRMGVGMPEYVLLFRKPPTDSTDGYADDRVVKEKSDYTRARWQVDAHGFWRSNGNRFLSAEELVSAPAEQIFKRFRDHSLTQVYDYEHHVAIGETLEGAKRLPPGFMLLQPQSWHDDVWTDVTRMRTLNGAQYAKGKEMHLCPLQFDIVDRLIERYTNKGETVFDPFGGLGTVAYCALKLARRGVTIELSAAYHADAVYYLRAAEEALRVPTLFDLDPVAEVA